MSSDELVSNFMAVSGCSDAQQALSYLEMSGNQLDTAVSLYMEHQAGGSSGDLMGGGGAAAGGFGGAEQEVRAPDRTRTMRLMDDVGPMGYGMVMGDADDLILPSAFAAVSAASIGDVRAAVNRAAARARDEAKENDEADNDDDEDEYHYDEDDEEDGEEVDADDMDDATGPSGLQDMFAPPKKLIHPGPFQAARQAAKDAKRWLLVNIQRDSEFSSHALNRDVWRDELVENLVREGFILWQTMDISSEGRTYSERYGVMDYPHVAILDPRTSRSLWKKEGWTQERPLTAEQFAESAMDFCSRHSFDEPPRAAPRAAATTAVTTSNGSKSDFQTEDEQLQAALAASLKPDTADDVIEVDDSMENEQPFAVATEDTKPMAVEEEKEDEKDASPFIQMLQQDVGDEPTASAARVQIRMPDAKRVVRKFSNDAKVSLIYAFVAKSCEDDVKDGKEFVLRAGFPPKDLWENLDQEIGSCQLNGQSITVRWKE